MKLPREIRKRLAVLDQERERTRELHRRDDEYALMRAHRDRPLSQKIDEAETVSDLIPILRELLSRLPPGEND